MFDTLKKAIVALTKMAQADRDSGNAQRYSQAACNLANTARVLADMPNLPAEGNAVLTDAQINRMVDRFLTWRLPEDFAPDGGISFTKIANAGTPQAYKFEPVGTNLFDATQALAMVRHMIAE